MKRIFTGNQLLDHLPEDEFARLAPHLEPVPLAFRQELYRVDEPLRYVFFPKTGIVSLLITMHGGEQVEAATIGNEGCTGFMVVQGLDTSLYHATCQVPGVSLRVPAAALTRALRPGSRLDAILRRYVAVLLRSANQLVACCELHGVESRMCRWLLMTHDRVGADEFPLTQEFLAEMLGVRRQTVTAAAGALQAQGLVSYRRGVLRVRHRAGLEAAACECYAVMKEFYDHTLNGRR